MTGGENFLSRWSRRKLGTNEARAKDTGEVIAAPAAAPVDSGNRRDDKPAEPVPLPPIESLTPDSDFTPFMQPDVDPGLKRQALTRLFADPRFNTMDGLDVYIDDYTKTAPIPAGWVGKMEQARRLGFFRREEETRAGEEAQPDTVAAVEVDEKVPLEQPVAQDLPNVPEADSKG